MSWMTTISRFTAILLAACCAAASGAERERLSDNWLFHLGDAEGAQRPEFDSSEWSGVRLPHDWSIGLPRSADEPSAGGGGFFPTGVGWYRRELEVAASPGERCWLVFEGVYRNAEVWLDGRRLNNGRPDGQPGRHAYGYTPFQFEVTEQLRSPGPHVLAVRVDNSAQPNSRWYSGSGIYRHVWLERRPLRSITPDSCVVRVDKLGATTCNLSAEAEVVNATPHEFVGRLRLEIIAASGEVVAAATQPVRVPADGSQTVAHSLRVMDVQAWGPADPAMYTALWAIEPEQADPEFGPEDEHAVSFGMRTVTVDAERGLLINGEPVVLYGGNVHHDNGCLGAAAYDEAEERRAQALADAGFNAVRTSHNPPSTAFLTACDRLGLLVIDEAFDCWAAAKVEHDFHEHFKQDWRRELAAMIRRDQNHPAVIMWSIGNEMYERGDDHAPAIAKEMASLAHKLDPTRPVTAGVNGIGEDNWRRLDALFAELDAVGYNYEQPRYDDDHRRVPDRVVYTSESYPKDLAYSHDAAAGRPYAIGDFVWSGIDYLGEAGIGLAFPPGAVALPHWEGVHFPCHGALCGDIDITGYRKPISYFRNIAWGRGERLAVAVVEPAPDNGQWQQTLWSTEPLRFSWTWPGHEGERLTVQVASRWPTVRIELNGRKVGEVATGPERGYVGSLSVPYAAGELTAVALDEHGREQERSTLKTAGPAQQITLSSEESYLDANSQDLCFIEVEIQDAAGRLRPNAEHQVTYTLSGPAEIIGVGSGNLLSNETYNTSQRRAHHGRALVVLRGGESPGEVTLTAQAEGLEPASLTLNAAQ
ncbi:Beta-galactosidase [Posidoniimonas polymericola]|uniref:Beta-galactosidase n=1 Tax=Posidoniimonas polymericola TaxID=2528002 RepID=A0A5C5YRR8_9BACT|nr:glycoside hydrolase family 2 TIM barrel-domain containing protein [Posidoniimonas polymericola]TWT77595.1 Beta-galactosidase [Posidoniimonas polymericola]